MMLPCPSSKNRLAVWLIVIVVAVAVVLINTKRWRSFFQPLTGGTVTIKDNTNNVTGTSTTRVSSYNKKLSFVSNNNSNKNNKNNSSSSRNNSNGSMKKKSTRGGEKKSIKKNTKSETAQSETEYQQQQLQQQQQQQQQDNEIITPRAFEKWNMSKSPLPCLSGGLDDKNKDGFIVVKMQKCASTTGASITLRIANNVGKRKFGLPSMSAPATAHNKEHKIDKKFNSMCRARTSHAPAHHIGWNKNDTSTKTFVWSIVREPSKRLVSWFFFQNKFEERNLTYSDDMFKKWMEQNKYYNAQSYYLQPVKRKNLSVAQHINTILRSYNFIGLVERIEESVVALQMILGLQTSDVLYVDSKRSGTGHIQSTYVTPTMQQYFDSEEYNVKTSRDLAMYKAINQSLDLTIDKLGRNEFEFQLQKLRTAKKLISDKCSKSKWGQHLAGKNNKPKRISNGKWCVQHNDWGCGFDCMDYVMSKKNNKMNKNNATTS